MGQVIFIYIFLDLQQLHYILKLRYNLFISYPTLLYELINQVCLTLISLSNSYEVVKSNKILYSPQITFVSRGFTICTVQVQ